MGLGPVDGAEPTVIVAVKDEKTMRSLLPSLWERKQGTGLPASPSPAPTATP